MALSNEQREFLIAKALESPQGREALAQAMAETYFIGFQFNYFVTSKKTQTQQKRIGHLKLS